MSTNRHNPRIWTGDVRRTLYRRLVQEFGPHSTWERENVPGNGRMHAYHEFLDAFAQWCGANSGRAVAHQIAYSLPHNTVWERAQAAILNKAAALEEGFITDADLPVLLAEHR